MDHRDGAAEAGATYASTVGCSTTGWLPRHSCCRPGSMPRSAQRERWGRRGCNSASSKAEVHDRARL